MLRDLLNVLLREVSSERLLPLPQNFYDAALSYIHSLKIRKGNEVSDVQRRIWEEECRVLEKLLSTIRSIRAKKIMMEAMEGKLIEGLPPEEGVYYANLKRALDLIIAEAVVESSEVQEEGKVLLLLRRSLDEDMAKKLCLPKLEAEDVIFINKRIGKMLINLGVADEVSTR